MSHIRVPGTSTGALSLKGRLLRVFSLSLVLPSLLSLLTVMTFTHNTTRAATVQPQSLTLDPNKAVPFGIYSGFEFVDLVKQGVRFDKLPGSTLQSLPLDDNGWPQADFQYIFADGRRNMPWNGADFNGTNPDLSGTYHLSFTGQAVLSTQGLEDPNAVEFQNVVYDASTNTTTADVVVHPNHWLLDIGFTQTKRLPGDTAGNGVTNLRLIRPGYPADTTQIFTSRFINALKLLGPKTFRTFDTGGNSYNIWNGSNLVTAKWSDRSLPSDSYWPLPSKNSGDKRGLSLPWEYVIQLCNTINADPWIIVPVSADDDYITQLATLFKNGDQFTSGLKPNLHLYVEYSNEVWNWSFSQSTYNQIQASSEGISLIDRYLERTIQISNLFSKVYGTAAINTTVRPVALWQYNTDLDIQNGLQWAQNKFNAPVNTFLYGIGEAPYIDPLEPSFSQNENGLAPYPDPTDPKAVDRIFDTFYTAAGNRRKAFTAWQTVATYYGLHEVGYESGPSLNAEIQADVSRSPRMVDFIQRYYLDNYFATGADAVNYFAFGPGSPCNCGDWYLFENWNHVLTSKFIGATIVSHSTRPAITIGNVLPWNVNDTVTIDASQYNTGSANLQKPGSSTSLCVNGCWPFPDNLDYLLRVPAAGTYSITLSGHSDNAAAQINVQVDNTSLGLVSLPQGSDGTTGSVTVALTPGLHTLVLTGAGTGRNTFSTSAGIGISLVSGGGAAIVPSAPVNVSNAVNDQQAVLNWESVTTATSYTIKRSTTSGGPYTTVGTSTTPTFTDSGLTDGTTYYYVITASNSAGESAASPQFAVIPTHNVAPAQPTNVTATSGGSAWTPFMAGGQVRISWPAVPDAVSYNIKRSTDANGPFNKIHTQTGTIYYDSSLNVGTTYYFVVSAVNAFGESTDSAVISVTPQITVPATPTQLKAIPGHGSVSLQWMQSAWQYPFWSPLFHVKRGTSANGPFTDIIDLSTNNVVDVGLSSGTQYCYVVSAVNTAGESADTQPVCVTPW